MPIRTASPMSLPISEPIDLTLPISPGAFVPPHIPAPSFRAFRTYDKDGRQTTLVTLYNHSGTHVDAPSHFICGGPTLDSLPLTALCGPARTLHLDDKKIGRHIELAHLARLRHLLHEGDRLLIHTGWDRHYGTPQYYVDFPAVSTALAEWLAATRISLVGIDTCSVAPVHDPVELARVHTILLSAGIVIVEGLCQLGRLPSEKRTDIMVLPLKLIGLDGAPARALAWADAKRTRP